MAARRQVEDRETAMAKSHTGLDVDSLIVGSAVRENPRHAPNSARVDRRAVELNDSGNAAHGYRLIPSRNVSP
jgi:hypothetical protein